MAIEKVKDEELLKKPISNKIENLKINTGVKKSCKDKCYFCNHNKQKK